MFQRETIVWVRADHDVLTALGGMGQHRREAVECAGAKLDHVVGATAGLEVSNCVLAEIGGEDEGIASSVACEHVVAGAARQRVVAGGAINRNAGARPHIACAIHGLSFKSVYCI